MLTCFLPILVEERGVFPGDLSMYSGVDGTGCDGVDPRGGDVVPFHEAEVDEDEMKQARCNEGHWDYNQFL